MAKQNEINIKGKVITKLNKHEAEIKKLKESVEKIKETQASLKETQNTLIADDLCARKPGLKAPLFSYREVAERHGVSVSTVQKVAEQKGLRREKDSKIS